jgi:rsbT co-antagonist protein RsbR
LDEAAHVVGAKKVKLDDDELRSRRAACVVSEEDLARLHNLRPFAEKHVSGLVDDFYDWLLQQAPTRKFLPDQTTIKRVKETQRRYFLGLFEGHCDPAYVEDRLRVGAAHQRIGLTPTWYLGAYRKYLALLDACLRKELPLAEAHAAMGSLLKLVFFDATLAIDTYIDANIEMTGRQQAALQDLSTPVIRVHDRILLLPLIGSVDSARAEQVIASVLGRIAEEHASVILIDIAGVPVVDTKVAGNLVKLAAMTALLGARTVVTGIGARVARAIVRLGIDSAAFDTRSSLQEGFALALDLIGKTIAPKAP